MKIPAEYDEIRPYSSEELPRVFTELLEDPMFQTVIAGVMPGVPEDMIARQLKSCKSNLEVQKTIFHPLLHDIIKQHSKGFNMDVSALTDKSRNYTFLSNHRDIVLDPGFLSVGLIDNNFPTTVEIAIGDNLLIYPWIKKLVRVNKAFIVQRGLSMRQQLASSIRMSQYIHFAITEKHENIWMAQREGRAKDSDDRTQDSVLKMLAMGGEGDVIDRLKELNIVPLSLSYEYDPCDYLKAQEMQQKRDNPEFKKSQQDDLTNMSTGIFGYKGRVTFRTSVCINDELEALRGTPRTEVFTRISALIDRHIHRNYRLYPGNYVAADLLEGNPRHAGTQYSEDEKKVFEDYLSQRIALISLPDKDEQFLRERLLLMYANPVRNYEKAIS